MSFTREQTLAAVANSVRARHEKAVARNFLFPPLPDGSRLIPDSKTIAHFIDPQFYDEVVKYAWQAHKKGGHVYATTNIKRPDGSYETVYLHSMIAHLAGLTVPGDGQQVDHKNREDTWDNRLNNLRAATPAENAANGRDRHPASGFRGVCRDGKKWRAQISAYIPGGAHRMQWLGSYDSKEAAALAYDRAATARYGEFAHLNFPNYVHRPRLTPALMLEAMQPSCVLEIPPKSPMPASC